MKYMTQMLLCFFLGCLGPSAWAQTSMQEKAESRLRELLAPGGKAFSPNYPREPLRWKPARMMEEITAPIQPYVGVPVHLPNRSIKPTRPPSVPEAQPLLAYHEPTQVPQQVELPSLPLIHLPKIDVHQPLPIPILAQPQKDRASLADPSTEMSLEAALKPLNPERSQPVPFIPLNLPDPFENVRTGQLRNYPEENPTMPVIPLQKPTK